MATAPVVTNPADYSTGTTYPFAITGTSDGSLVAAFGENGLLLPATENPVQVVGGAYSIENVSSLVGDHGAVLATGAGYAQIQASANASPGGAAQAQRSVSGTAAGVGRATLSVSATPGGTASAGDTTAPSVGTLTVTGGTNGGTFSVTATDSGVSQAFTWELYESASAVATSYPPAGATKVANGTQTGTSLSLSGQAFTSNATSTGVRHWRVFVKDAAGNGPGYSANDASATVTVTAGNPATLTVANDAHLAAESTDSYGGTNGGVMFGQQDLSLGADPTGKSAVYYHTGAITPTITGPLTSLKLKLKCSYVSGTPDSGIPLVIRIVASLNPPMWSNSNKPTLVSKNAATVSWTLGTGSGVVGVDSVTPELISLVNAVGWSSGSAVGFVIECASSAINWGITCNNTVSVLCNGAT